MNLNAVAIDVVSGLRKGPTAAMPIMKVVKVPEATGREYSRMAPHIKAVHLEALFYFGHQEREIQSICGLKPGTMGRIKDYGDGSSSTRSNIVVTDEAIDKDQERFDDFLLALNNLRDIRRQAMVAFYDGKLGLLSVKRKLGCSVHRARNLIAEARQSIADFYAGARIKIG